MPPKISLDSEKNNIDDAASPDDALSTQLGEKGRELLESAQLKAAAVQKIRDRIVRSPVPKTLESAILPLAEIDMLLDEGLSEAELAQNLHPDKGVRRAAELCKQKLAEVASNLGLDRELYDIAATFEKTDTQNPILNRFIACTLRDFRRSGVDKDARTRARIHKIKDELVRLGQKFNRNIREDTRDIVLESAEQMSGLPADFIAAHAPDEKGKIRISTDTQDFVPFMSYAHDKELRRALYLEYLNRACPKNDAVLAEILAKRHRLACLLGHSSYASFVSADKMIGSAEAAAEFIDRVAEIAEKRAQEDVRALLKRKQKDEPEAESIEDFEKAYYAKLVRTESLSFDAQEVRPYFEYNKVKKGVLDTASELFGITFKSVSKSTWHPSVEVFDVLDGDTNLGRMYLDMHSREFKYKHAAVFPMRSGIRGKRLPRAALVCNFPNPAEKHPALLEHSEVVTFFHEFGHMLHHLLGGHQDFCRFSGTAAEWDFVEVPSQLLEEWAYSHEVLGRFAFHVETNEPIPRETVERLNRARTFGRGADARRQMFYAALSYHYHADDPTEKNLLDVLVQLQEKYCPYRRTPGTHMHASFGHLEGYSALYYTYMWSLVIVRDLFSQFKEHGLFNKEIAERYRKCILDPGGAEDAKDMIRNFLGRDYNFEAFTDWVNAR